MRILQGFSPYRKSQIECNEINRDAIRKMASSAEDWMLIQKIFESTVKNTQDEWIISEETKNMLMMYLNNAFDVEKEIKKDKIQLDTCLEKLQVNAENLSVFLQITRPYQDEYTKLKSTLNKINISNKDFVKKNFVDIKIPFPETLKDIDDINYILINPENLLGNYNENKNEFMQKLHLMVNINVKIRQEMLSSSSSVYKTWQDFYASTNQMFIKCLQSHL